jgi:hypothetical protein
MRMLANSILYAAQVPYLMDNAGLRNAYGSDLPFISRRVRVPREFFFDALAALAEADHGESDAKSGEWECPACGETVPADFDVCWNCNSEQDTGNLSDESSS